MIKLFAILFSLSVQAGLPPTTLSGQSSATKPTTFGTQVPYSQATSLGGVNSLIETGNENMLVDPNMEAVGVTAYTCTSGTCTKTSTAGEFTSGKQALKVALSAQALNVSQSVSTTSGIQVQGVVGVAYKVPSAVTDFQICSLVAGSEQTCVPSANIIADGLYHSIEIPVTMTAGSTVGIKAKTTATYTQNIFLDAAYIKQGIGYQNLMLDNVYSATSSTAGVVSLLSKTGWVANASKGGTGLYSFPISGFTQAPVCNVTSNTGSNVVCMKGASSSSSTLNVYCRDVNSNAFADNVFDFTCQKSGNDYLASSANVYSAASANYDWTSYTPTLTGFGTATGVSFYHRRVGGNLEIRGRFTSGTSTATEARLSLPNSLITNSNISTIEIAQGFWMRDAAASAHGSAMMMEPSVGYVAFGQGDGFSGTATSGVTKMLGSSYVASGNTVWLSVSIPISGWSNSNVIVGSFAGYTNVPGYQGNVDTFSVSYGTTNATTVCSASPCSYLDQIGNAVTSVSRSSAGTYVLNTTKTYTKIKCTGSLYSPDLIVMRPVNSASSSASTFFTVVPTTGVGADSAGTLDCIGSY